MSGIIARGEVYRERRHEFEKLRERASTEAPHLLPELERLLWAEWITRDELRQWRQRLKTG